MQEKHLPTLPFSPGALEPHMDTETVTSHFENHHVEDVKLLNRALRKYPFLLAMSAERLASNLDSIPADIRDEVRYAAGSHANHTLFWSLLNKDSPERPVQELAMAVNRTFGTFENFKVEFEMTSLGHRGSGWAWLSLGSLGNLLVHSTERQDSPLMAGRFPIVGIDLWEHAYYLKHRNRRQDYLSEFWQLIDWDRAESNYREASTALSVDREPAFSHR